ncbi:GNAT family N-acetyltransferase [Paractinoplanes globisporus]|uniref:GNAT family N-acetyltransferase n=1 Tax=Paractinoplanes globisporus TaxID=113565 RepID=A0ABW6WUW6_9ACTN|nr:GNAT family N-acetyltransferase [Actinoplanes globisporus]
MNPLPESVEVRRGTPRDAATLLALQHRLDAQSRFMLLEPGERADDPAAVARRLGDQLGFDILAFHHDIAVGWAQVEVQPWARVRHIGYVVLGVDREHHARGVGTRLMKAAVHEAGVAGLTRLELTVMTDNAPAIRLYLRHGFVVEGVRRRAIMRGSGQYVDELSMGLLLPGPTSRQSPVGAGRAPRRSASPSAVRR